MQQESRPQYSMSAASVQHSDGLIAVEDRKKGGGGEGEWRRYLPGSPARPTGK